MIEGRTESPETSTSAEAGMSTKAPLAPVGVRKNIGAKNLLAFFVLGVCNNMGYVVMLSAAHDILSNDNASHKAEKPDRDCNAVSTGAILLADIIPGVLVKIASPFFPLHEHVRIGMATIFAAVAFCCVGYSITSGLIWLAYAGVVLTAFSSSIGEATLLPFMSFYCDKNVITAWGSGTGGAGFLGAFFYAAMVGIGFTPALTMYVLVSVPLTMAISFWIILDRPNIGQSTESSVESQNMPNDETDEKNIAVKTEPSSSSNAFLVPVSRSTFTFSERLAIIPKLYKYMLPLGLVYYFEYVINQGLFELLYFKGTWLDHSDQYRWYQVLYQIGVFLSRSSLTFIKFNHLWLFAFLQFCNAVYLYFDAVYYLSPSLFLVFGLILFEGLLGGAAYVNTFYKIDTEMPTAEREFAMSMSSFADSLGISLAGLTSIPLHNHICFLPVPKR